MTYSTHPFTCVVWLVTKTANRLVRLDVNGLPLTLLPLMMALCRIMFRSRNGSPCNQGGRSHGTSPVSRTSEPRCLFFLETKPAHPLSISYTRPRLEQDGAGAQYRQMPQQRPVSRSRRPVLPRRPSKARRLLPQCRRPLQCEVACPPLDRLHLTHISAWKGVQEWGFQGCGFTVVLRDLLVSLRAGIAVSFV